MGFAASLEGPNPDQKGFNPGQSLSIVSPRQRRIRRLRIGSRRHVGKRRLAHARPRIGVCGSYFDGRPRRCACIPQLAQWRSWVLQSNRRMGRIALPMAPMHNLLRNGFRREAYKKGTRFKAAAAPATVSGELMFTRPLAMRSIMQSVAATKARPPQAGILSRQPRVDPDGDDGSRCRVRWRTSNFVRKQRLTLIFGAGRTHLFLGRSSACPPKRLDKPIVGRPAGSGEVERREGAQTGPSGRCGYSAI